MERRAVVFLALVGWIASMVPSVSASGSQAASPKVRRELQAAYDAIARAVAHTDPKSYAKYLAPDFTCIGEDGEVAHREQMLSASADSDGATASFKILGLATKNNEAIATVNMRVRAVGFAPDGTAFGIDETAKLRHIWTKTASGWKLREWRQYVNGVFPVDDRKLALQPVRKWSDPGAPGIAEFSTVDQLFAFITPEGGVRVTDPGGRRAGEWKGDGEQATCLAYAPDGARILLGTRSGKVLVWEPSSGKAARVVFENPGCPVARVAWLANPDRGVMAKSVDFEKRKSEQSGFVFDLSSGTILCSFSSFVRDDFRTLAASPDGKKLAVLEIPDQPRAAFLLDAETCKPAATLYHKDYQSGPLSVIVAPDSRTTAVGYGPYHLSIWDGENQRLLKLIKGHSNWVVSLAFSPDGSMLISGAGDSTARIWNVATGREIGRIRFRDESTYVRSVAFSGDGSLVLAAAENGELVIAKSPPAGR